MSLYDDLRKKLSPEMFNSVVDTLGDDFEYDVVPRTRLNEVIRQRNSLRKQLSESSQTSDTADENNNVDDDGTTVTPKSTVKSKQVDESALRAEWETEQKIREEGLRVEFATLNQLREDGAIDPELALTLLDASKIKRKDGKLTGYEEQLEALRESKSFLFHQRRQRRQDVDMGTGKNNGENDSSSLVGVMTKDNFLKLSYEQQVEFKEAHPDQFNKFLTM